MDNEEIIRRFVEKRTALRKLELFSIVGVVVFAMLANSVFARQVAGAYSDMYNAIIIVWFYWLLALTIYVGTVLSVCPLCRHDLKTMDVNQSTRRISFNVGALPNYCPYCGANFTKHNKFKM